MPKKITSSDFIKSCIDIHGDIYRYDKCEYKGAFKEVKIYCKRCGDYFNQIANYHKTGRGCPRCKNERSRESQRLSYQEIIEKAKIVHGDSFSYHESTLKNVSDFLHITCNSCNHSFKQRARDHLYSKAGCPECKRQKLININTYTKDQFIERCKEIHGNKYDYSLTDISKREIEIICPIHGKFRQDKNIHLSGSGCQICGGGSHKPYTTKTWIEKAKKVHGNLYNYDKVSYKTQGEKVDIICKKHGIFSQRALSHHQGSGCPKCKSSKGEKLIINFLSKRKINFKHQHVFDECINPLTNKVLKFDFFIAEQNLVIEFDGRQHFEDISYFNESLEYRKFKDSIKDNYCKEKKINLIRIPYWEDLNKKLISLF